MKFFSLVAILLWPLLASAQLAVTVSPVKVAGQKAIVPLVMKNHFAEKVASARAVVFLLDDQGKMIGQSTKWVIGGAKDRPALETGKETPYNFVIAASKPFTTTNLTAKVTFSRVVLAGGKLADTARQVIVTTADK
jgi:hypothetical protein